LVFYLVDSKLRHAEATLREAELGKLRTTLVQRTELQPK
jgi:hypothetical protein